jgi:hypothetical protein
MHRSTFSGPQQELKVSSQLRSIVAAPGEIVSIGYETGWNPEPVWTSSAEGFELDPSVIRASQYVNY